MSKWSLFYLLVPIAGVAIFAVAPFVGWSLPENVSTFGRDIDQLYYGILVITGVVFIATQLALCYILYTFGDAAPQGTKADYTHGSRKLEILWTVVPAIVLLFIALYQMPAWIEIRFPQSKPNIPPIARVVARQFEWRMVYPGPDGQMDTSDDVHVPNELHIIKGARTLIDLRTMDVLHSFFLPHLRVKQDAVPGLAIPVWFDALKSTREFQSEAAGYRPSQVRHPEGLFAKLDLADDPIAAHLKALLGSETRDSLSYPADDALVAKLLDDLNGVLASTELYSPERFAKVTLSEETKRNLAAKPVAGPLLLLLNRKLLDDAWPHLVEPLGRHYDLVCAELCGWGHYKMKGRLYVHDTREEFNAWMADRVAEQEASR